MSKYSWDHPKCTCTQVDAESPGALPYLYDDAETWLLDESDSCPIHSQQNIEWSWETPFEVWRLDPETLERAELIA